MNPFDKEAIAKACEETNRLRRELDITNADHIALWIEANTIPDEPMSQCASWLACRIVEAHEKAQATRIEALEARWTMIDKLRAAEGHSVTIIHDNPDFGGPNCVIHVSTSYGQDWEAYYGDTVDDCLRKAVEALEGKSNG